MQEALSAKGVTFGERVEPEDVLKAALAALESQSVNSLRRAMQGKTYGRCRSDVIANARAEWNDPAACMICDCRTYIDGSLREAGFARLTEAECLELPVGYRR